MRRRRTEETASRGEWTMWSRSKKTKRKNKWKTRKMYGCYCCCCYTLLLLLLLLSMPMVMNHQGFRHHLKVIRVLTINVLYDDHIWSPLDSNWHLFVCSFFFLNGGRIKDLEFKFFNYSIAISTKLDGVGYYSLFCFFFMWLKSKMTKCKLGTTGFSFL